MGHSSGVQECSPAPRPFFKDLFERKRERERACTHVRACVHTGVGWGQRERERDSHADPLLSMDLGSIP